MSKPGNYSSQSYSPSDKKPLKSVSIDASGNSKNKDALVGLNDRFIALIDKVRNLEAEKKKLQTKLRILKEQESYNGKIEDIVKKLENELELQIDNLKNDREKLENELEDTQREVEDTKKKYEDKMLKRSDLENDFIVNKKEVDESHMVAVGLALEFDDLMRTLDFRNLGYDEELKELESRIGNETVVIDVDGKRPLNMDEIVKGVEQQYATMAANAREEAEQWNRRKIESLVQTVGQREQDVRDVKREISDLLRLIQKLNGDLDALKRKEDALMKDIDDVRKEGEDDLSRAREGISLLEDALKRARQDLVSLVRDHQELLNIKLAMDIEIATYRKLLEGEEQRMNDLLRQLDVHLPLTRRRPAKTKAPEPTPVPDTTTTPIITLDTTIIPPVSPATRKRLLIRLEVEEGKLVSESCQYTD